MKNSVEWLTRLLFTNRLFSPTPRSHTQPAAESSFSGFAETFYELGQFTRKLRYQLRFGSLSRAPLQLLRFEVRGSTAECEIVARPLDLWDRDLMEDVRHRNATVQALEDALAVRSLLFRFLPSVSSATLRVYRKSGADVELIILGALTREDPGIRVLSPVMHAQLCGLRFCLDDGVLMPVQS